MATNAKMKIKKGDQVVVLTGREKGKSGEVLRVDRRAQSRSGAGREHGQTP